MKCEFVERGVSLQKKANDKVKKYKLLWILTILFFFPIIYLVINSIIEVIDLGERMSVYAVLHHIDYKWLFETLCGTCFSTVIIGFAYECFIRNESNESLKETIRNELFFDVDILKKYSDDQKKKILYNVLRSYDVQSDLAKHEMKLMTHYGGKDIWQDYKCDVIIKNSDLQNYRVIITMHYRSARWKDIYKFIVVGTQNDFNKVLNCPEYEIKWLLPTEENYDYLKKRDVNSFLDKLQRGFELKYIEINSVPIQIGIPKINNEMRGLEYIAELPENINRGVECVLVYTYECEVEGNSLYMTVPFPTRNLSYTFDYSQCRGVVDVDVFDYFNGLNNAKIYNRKETKRIEVTYDSWTLPKGGIVFVWNKE